MSTVEELAEKADVTITPASNSNEDVNDGEKGHVSKEEQTNPATSEPQQSASIGIISGEYQCVHNHMQGTLVAGTEALVFDGRFFFYKHTVVVKWSNVKSVLKTEIGVIQVSDHQEMVYEFTGIQHADRVWATLVTLHNESNLDRPLHSPLQTAVKASFRRMSTEPILLFDDSSNLPKEEAAYMAAATMAQMDDMRGLSERRIAPKAVAMERHADLSTDLEAAWTELHDSKSKDKSYADVAIKDGDLVCSLDVFFNVFYADDAPHSVPRFMQENGDKDLSASPWKQDGTQWKRTIEYSHPINAPLAPPEARARKEQRYRRFGDHGLSIETDTFVDDVPMADCFYVTDRILVKSTENSVRLTGEFDIRFVKTTMFRSIISNTTRREFLKNFAMHYAMMEAALLLMEEPAVEKRKSMRQSLVRGISKRLSLSPLPKTRAVDTEAVPGNRGGPGWITLLALAAVLGLQVYIIYEVRSMKGMMVEQRQHDRKTCVSPV